MAEATPEPNETLPPEPLRVAFVDDNQGVREQLSILLQESFDSFEVFETAQQVIDRFEKENPPNVLLTDGEMPEMNGLQLARHIKNKFANTTIILISAGMRGVDLKENGLDLYIQKDQLIMQGNIANHLIENIRALRQNPL